MCVNNDDEFILVDNDGNNNWESFIQSVSVESFLGAKTSIMSFLQKPGDLQHKFN